MLDTPAFILSGYTLKPGKQKQDQINILYFVNPWTGDPYIEANTRYYSYGNYIIEADITFNIQDYSYTPAPNISILDLESLTVHELGHILGLDHSDEENSVMYPYLSFEEIRRNLTILDKSNILCGYNKN